MSVSEPVTKDYLAEVCALVLSKLEAYPCRVYLYGSRATGKAWRSSDVDIAVWPLEPLPPGTLAKIREALHESHVPYHVELVDLSHSDEAFRDRVLREGVLWNEHENA